MLKYIETIFYLTNISSNFIKQYYLQKKAFSKNHSLQNFLVHYSPYLSKYDLYRIKDYSVRISALCICIFKDIYKERLDKQTQNNIVLFSAFIPVFDDICDNTLLSKAEIKQIFKNPELFIPENKKEEAAFNLFKILYNELGQNKIKKIWHSIYKVFLIQFISKQQKSDKISFETLNKITNLKGGYSLLLCRNLTNIAIKEKEYDIYMQIGAYLQWLDDIFDISNDLKDGLFTPANFIKNINQLEFLIKSKLYETIDIIRFLNNKKNIKKSIYRIFILFIPTIAIINQYKRLQKRKDSNFEFIKLSKKETELKIFNISTIALVLKNIYNFNPNIPVK
jgi:hypothetical protein